jgi:hypothetical protein
MSSRGAVAGGLEKEIRAVLSACWGGARYGAKIRAPHALVMTVLFRNDLSSMDKVRNVVKLAAEHAGNLASFAAVYKTLLVALKWASKHLRLAAALSASDRSATAPLWRSLGRAVMSLLIDGPIIHLPDPRAVGESTPDNLHRIRTEGAPPGHPENVFHSFVAGAVGGYLIWGRYSSVNYQIVLYLTSRVLVGLGKKFLLRQSSGDKALVEGDLRRGAGARGYYYPFAAALVWGTVMALFEESPEVLHPTLRASMDEIYRSQHFSLP